ncbi:MAG: hypothetical protein NUW23_01275 [Firmicutes bacterium]|jgi:hypothetical protein|nr:hypothetical protein [Bacillota bacterium]
MITGQSSVSRPFALQVAVGFLVLVSALGPAGAVLSAPGELGRFTAPAGARFQLDELCDVLGVLNLQALAAVDTMIETRDLKFRAAAMEALEAMKGVLAQIKAVPDIAERIPAAVDHLEAMRAGSIELVRRMGDRMTAFVSGRLALSSALAEIDALVARDIEPLLNIARTRARSSPTNTAAFTEITGAVRQMELAAYLAGWGAAREVQFADANAAQKARKAMHEATSYLELASSNLDAQFISRDVSLFSPEENRALKEHMNHLARLSMEIPAHADLVYASWKVMTALYSGFAANVYTTDKYISSELLGICFS